MDIGKGQQLSRKLEFETGTLRNVSSDYELMYWIVHRWFNGFWSLIE